MAGTAMSTARIYGLSKSRITAFAQCPKKLWFSVHKREVAETQSQSELRFAAGHDVGAIACELSLGGVMIEAQPDLKAALKQTAELLAAGHRAQIYEATFVHDGVLDLVVGRKGLSGDARVTVALQEGIKNSVGNPIAKLVGVSGRHRFRRK